MSLWSEGRGRGMPRGLPPPFGRALMVRVALVWLGIHFAAGVLLPLMGRATYEALLLGAYSVAWVWGFVIAAVLLDMRTRNEHLILGNLGFSAHRVALLALGQCAVMESVAHALAAGGLSVLRAVG